MYSMSYQSILQGRCAGPGCSLASVLRSHFSIARMTRAGWNPDKDTQAKQIYVKWTKEKAESIVLKWLSLEADHIDKQMENKL